MTASRSAGRAVLVGAVALLLMGCSNSSISTTDAGVPPPDTPGTVSTVPSSLGGGTTNSPAENQPSRGSQDRVCRTEVAGKGIRIFRTAGSCTALANYRTVVVQFDEQAGCFYATGGSRFPRAIVIWPLGSQTSEERRATVRVGSLEVAAGTKIAGSMVFAKGTERLPKNPGCDVESFDSVLAMDSVATIF